MSNELNVTDIFQGTIDPGVELEFYDWHGDYDTHSKRAWFCTVAPDPWIEIPGFGDLGIFPNKLDLQVTATWSTVWADIDANLTYQRNTRVVNIGGSTATYHVIRAETDN
jgi:hypothetical protein